MRGEMVQQRELASRHAHGRLIDVDHAPPRVDAEPTDLDVGEVSRGDRCRGERARIEHDDVVFQGLDRQATGRVGVVTHLDGVARPAKHIDDAAEPAIRAAAEHQHTRLNAR